MALAAAGASVALAGRTLEKVETTATMIRERGGDALALACDVKSAADLAVIVEATVAQLGGGPNGAAIGPDGHAYVCNIHRRF